MNAAPSLHPASPGIDPVRAAEFDRLLALTRALHGHLETGAWGDAAEVEAERRVVIERIFDEKPAEAELPMLTATLREVVRLNDELVGLADHRRRALEREVDTAGRGRVAVRAYTVAGALPGGARP